MCVHGAIGVAVTLASIGRLTPGAHRFETPVGVVGVELREDGQVAVENVISYRLASAVEVIVDWHKRRNPQHTPPLAYL